MAVTAFRMASSLGEENTSHFWTGWEEWEKEHGKRTPQRYFDDGWRMISSQAQSNPEEDKDMNYLNMPRDQMERELEAKSQPIRLIMEEFARRDAGRDIVDHHERALEDFVMDLDVENCTLHNLGCKLHYYMEIMALPALIWETRFRDATYTTLIYNALEPLRGRE